MRSFRDRTVAGKRAIRAFILLMVTAIALGTAGPVYAKKKAKYKYIVTLAHAKNDEKGRFSSNSYGSKPGDQTKREVAMDSYNSYSGWRYVARPKSAKAARIIAKQAIAGCKNNRIGYGKSGLSLYDEAEKVGFKLGKIRKKVNTDCFEFVHTCCRAAGITASPIYLDDEKKAGEEDDDEDSEQKSYEVFEIFKDKAYRKNAQARLKVGDILVRKGKKQHAAIVCKIKKVKQ